MKAVYKREIQAYLHNVYGFLFAAVLLLVFGFMIFMFNLNPNYLLSDMMYSFMYGEIALILMVPILCMRAMSEDKRNKTDLFYLSLPMRTGSVVLGKYLALLTVFAIPTLIICIYPLILSLYGNVNLLHTYTGIFMFYLLGASLMAICMYMSSLTEHMVVSAVLGVMACGVIYFLPMLAELLPVSALSSYVTLVVIALLVCVAVYFFAKSLTVALITASATLVPLSVAFVVGEIMVKNGKLQTSFMSGLTYWLFYNISPFFQFESTYNNYTFDIFSVIMMLSIVAVFLSLTIQQVDRRRWA